MLVYNNVVIVRAAYRVLIRLSNSEMWSERTSKSLCLYTRIVMNMIFHDLQFQCSGIHTMLQELADLHTCLRLPG